MNKYLLAALAILLYPMASQAGAGFEFRIENRMRPTPEDPDYPQITVHRVGGSSCWYDYGLDDWNQYAKPGGNVRIYTERKNSGTCYWLLTDPAVRGVAYFIKMSKSSNWRQVGDEITFENRGNSQAGYWGNKISIYSNGIYINAKYPVAEDVSLLPLLGSDLTWADITVVGIPQYPVASKSLLDEAPYAIAATEFDTAEENDPVQAIDDVMQTGEKKVFKLAGLDPESEWELDQCTGDAVLSSAVIPQHTRKKDLPDALEIRAIKPGQSVCELTAWHYPERSKIISRRYTFNVRAP